MRSRSVPTALLALGLAAVAPAQKIGTEAPELTWERTFGFGDVPNQKLSDLRGSVVAIMFWSSYSRTCIQEIPGLNRLFAEKSEEGLVVIGVTSDDANIVAAYVTKNAVKYPVATAQSKEYRVEGTPEAIVIDKEGKVAWRGHPANLDQAGLGRLLAGAKPAVTVAGLEPVAELRRSSDFGGAWKKGKELLDGGTLSERAKTQAGEWLQKIEQFVGDAVAKADAAEAAGDPYGVWASLDPVASHYQGVPGADGAKDRVAKLLADAKTKKEIEVGKKLAEAKAKEAAFEFDAAYEIYKLAAQNFSTTKGGKVAAAAVKELEKNGKLGFQASCPYCKAGGVACPTHKKKKK